MKYNEYLVYILSSLVVTTRKARAKMQNIMVVCLGCHPRHEKKQEKMHEKKQKNTRTQMEQAPGKTQKIPPAKSPQDTRKSTTKTREHRTRKSTKEHIRMHQKYHQIKTQIQVKANHLFTVSGVGIYAMNTMVLGKRKHDVFFLGGWHPL